MIQKMIAYALKKNYEYIAITNHTEHLKIAKGMTEKELIKYIIKRVNDRYHKGDSFGRVSPERKWTLAKERYWLYHQIQNMKL